MTIIVGERHRCNMLSRSFLRSFNLLIASFQAASVKRVSTLDERSYPRRRFFVSTHTILARCPSANQLATTSQKTKYENSQMSPEAYPGAI